MMYSAELRWFFRGPVPKEILLWFKKKDDSQPEKIRTDEYLFFPDCNSISLKMREGKFEVKAILSPPKPINFSFAVNGRTDHWVKWSFEDGRLPALFESMKKSARWIPVQKERYLRKWSAEHERPVEVDPKQLPGSGCIIELTLLQAGENREQWHTLGFEAFGPVSSVAGILDQTVKAFFLDRSYPSQALNESNSMSYACWLNVIA
jgi:hypothetical protein